MMGTRTPYPSARNAASTAQAAGSPGHTSRAEQDWQDVPHHRTFASAFPPILFGTADAGPVIACRARLGASGSRNRVSDAGMRPAAPHGSETGASDAGSAGVRRGLETRATNGRNPAADWKPALRRAGTQPRVENPRSSPAEVENPRYEREPPALSPRHARLSPHRSRNRGFRCGSAKVSAGASCSGTGAARRPPCPAAPCGSARRPRSCPRRRARSRPPRRR